MERPSRSIKEAARPATRGQATEVPDIGLVAVVDPIQVDRMLEAGAKISTVEPKLEKELRASVLVELPTVMAFGAEAGE